MEADEMKGEQCQAQTLKGHRCTVNGTSIRQTHDGRIAWVCKHHASGYIHLYEDDTPEKADVPKIGQTIKELRQIRGWSLPELHQISGVAGETLRSWERGECNPSIRALHQVAQAFDASASDLLKDAGL